MHRLVVLFGACLIAAGQSAAEFEVASVKPNKNGGSVRGGCHGIDSKYGPDLAEIPLGRCVITAGRLSHMIGIAWGVDMGMLKGGPEWTRLGFDRFNVEAKAEDPAHTTDAQLLEMLQALLIGRFQLKYHREPIERAGFALVVGKNGPRMKSASGAETIITSRPQKPEPGQQITLTAHRTPMSLLTQMISVDGPVIDKTGLTGEYDFTLTWDDDKGPTLQTAVQEQLGLKLEPQKVTVDLFVIDSAQKPSAN